MTQPQTEFLQLNGPTDATWINYDARESVRRHGTGYVAWLYTSLKSISETDGDWILLIAGVDLWC